MRYITPLGTFENWETAALRCLECDFDPKLTIRVEPEYQYWQHRRSGEVWAVRLEGGRVTGACGPLPRREATPANLAYMHYDDDPDTTAWVRRQSDDFGPLYEP